MINSLHNRENLEVFSLQSIKNQKLIPIIDTQLDNLAKLTKFCLREEMKYPKDRDDYRNNLNFKINLKVPNPSQLTFILDYESYNFDFY